MPGKRRRLGERRRAVGHAHEQIAALLGVDRTIVQRWEAGETTPQPWLRPKLAEVLGVSLEELDAMLTERQTEENGDAVEELADDREPDPVLVAPWNQRGTMEAVLAVSGGDPVKRRVLLLLTGPALTAPAHQWLVREPEPLASGLSGRRVGAGLAEQLTAMVTEVRKMDDIAGGGSVLSLAAHDFGWAAYDAGHHALAQRYYVTALRTAHSADDRPLGAHILSVDCLDDSPHRLNVLPDDEPAQCVRVKVDHPG